MHNVDRGFGMSHEMVRYKINDSYFGNRKNYFQCKNCGIITFTIGEKHFLSSENGHHMLSKLMALHCDKTIDEISCDRVIMLQALE